MRFFVCLSLAIASVVVGFAQTNTIQLRNGANTTTLIAPSGGNYTLTLPAGAGTNGQVLSTDGSGTLSWTTAGGATALSGLSDVKKLANGSGFDNSIIIGHQITGVLSANAVYNYAFGVDALRSITDGDYNIAIGSSALRSVSTGPWNIGIGDNAGYSISGGDNNLFIGANAGYGVTTASNNIGIGQQALQNQSSSTSSTNIAIGFRVMQNGPSLDNNIGIGTNVLKAATSATNNVAIGTEAGIALTSGDANVLIGPYAGFRITTGSRNVFIGQSAGDDLSIDTEEDLLIIENSNNVTTPLIYGNFNTNVLTFNAATTMTGNVTVGGGATASELRLLEPSGSGSHYTAFKAQAQTADITYTLPSGITASGRFLKVMSPGTLSWEHIMPYRSVSASASAWSSDNTLDVDASGGSVTISLSSSAGVNVEAGKLLIVRKLDASTNTVVIDPSLTETVNGASTYTLTRQYETVVIQSNGSDWIILDSYTPVTIYTATAAANAATIDANMYSSAIITGDGAGTADVITINNGYEGQTITIFYDATPGPGVDQPQVNGKDWGTAGSDVGLTCTKLGGTWRVVGVAAY